VCMLTKLHYDEFTDLTWSPDGQCLILSSRDGYCTLIVFDEILPAYHTQQHTLQLQSIAHHNSLPISYPPNSPFSPATPLANPLKKRNEPPLTPVASVDGSEGPLNIAQPQSIEGSLDAKSASVLPMKRNEPPLTPAASVDGSEGPSNLSQQQSQSVEGGLDTKTEDHDKVQGPPKKKRRVALTRVGDLES